MKVTAVKSQNKGRNRFSIFIDGEYSLGLGLRAFEESGIFVGKEISTSELENLKSVNRIYQALDRACKYMANRPRSESEVRNRLRRYGYDEMTVNSVIDRLRKSGLVDDTAFASFWKENRSQFQPRSARMLTAELRQKGVDPQTVTQVASEIDDRNEALRAGAKKARSLSQADYPEFRRKLTAFLYRRGFDYDVIGSTVEHFWNEKHK